MSRRRRRSVLGAGMCWSALTVFLASIPGGAQDVGAATGAFTERQRARVTPIVEAVRRAKDAVVNVTASQVVTESRSIFDIFEVPERYVANSVGAGTVIHPSGYVLTNAHVVARASEVSVVLASGKSLPAHIVAALPESDLAILKADVPRGVQLPTIPLGRSADIMVGETVIAIGAPVGLSHSVTSGIISATNRSLEPNEKVRFAGILQTDAAINPGNSGGPLLNILGEQIGVNTAIRSDAQNVGFAIPIDRVLALLPDLLTVDGQRRGILGLRLGPAEGGGARIVEVASGTPAAQAKIDPGLTIVSVGGTPTPTLVDALVAFREQPLERTFTILARQPEGLTDHFEVKIAARPPPNGSKLARALLGMDVVDLDVGLATRLGIRRDSGVVVRSAERGRPAARAGIEAGDLVTRVGAISIRSVDDLAVLDELEGKKGVSLAVRVLRLTRRGWLQAEVVVELR